MRNLLCVAAMVLVAGPSLARERRGKPQADTRVAVVDDEPTSHAAAEPAAAPARTNAADPNATGSIRSAQVSAPEVTSVAVRKEPAHPTEHTVAVEPPPPVATAPVKNARPNWLADLEEAHGRREMRPYQAALSGCTQRKLRREPDARGTLLLDIQVGEDSIAHAKVTDSTITDDPQLKSCLEGIIEGKSFNASNLHFTWTVKIFPRTTVAASESILP